MAIPLLQIWIQNPPIIRKILALYLPLTAIGKVQSSLILSEPRPSFSLSVFLSLLINCRISLDTASLSLNKVISNYGLTIRKHVCSQFLSQLKTQNYHYILCMSKLWLHTVHVQMLHTGHLNTTNEKIFLRIVEWEAFAANYRMRRFWCKLWNEKFLLWIVGWAAFSVSCCHMWDEKFFLLSMEWIVFVADSEMRSFCCKLWNEKLLMRIVELSFCWELWKEKFSQWIVEWAVFGVKWIKSFCCIMWTETLLLRIVEWEVFLQIVEWEYFAEIEKW